MTEPLVSVIIPARDSAATLERTLTALADQTLDEPFEVLVVDDGSRDGTAQVAERHAAFVRLIQNERSMGPGAARNRGVAQARGSVLAFTDADCFPTPTWLVAGMRHLSNADIVQGRVRPDPEVPRRPFDRSLSVESDAGFYQTANLFVRRDTFDHVGGFRDWVLEQRGNRRWSKDRRRGRTARTPIGEDTLFAWTARRHGARSAFARDALVHHAVVPGGVLDDMADRWHWARDMPGLARLVPELRDATFCRRVFFNQVSAWFDLALAGLLGTLVSGRPVWMLASRPYLRYLRGQSYTWPRREQVSYLLGAPFVDLATLVGLLTGSVSWRSLIL
jgi:glycosyltransferase involved in cell wall biosynthesis